MYRIPHGLLPEIDEMKKKLLLTNSSFVIRPRNDLELGKWGWIDLHIFSDKTGKRTALLHDIARIRIGEINIVIDLHGYDLHEFPSHPERNDKLHALTCLGVLIELYSGVPFFGQLGGKK